MQSDTSRDAHARQSASGAILALSLAALVTPAYWLLDEHAVLPLALRDRPWPLAIAAVALALLAARAWTRLRLVAAVVAIGSVVALGTTAHLRYRLPPTSAHAVLGKPLPAPPLTDDAGAAVSLRALPPRPTLLVWFRGAWCPYCRKQLAELAAEATRFPSDAFSIVAITADPPAPLAKLRADLHLQMTLLSDPERALMNVCELGHCVALVDARGIVTWAALSGNWEKQLPARALLQAAYRLGAR